MAHTHSGLAKSRFCIPRTRCEPYGAHSFWLLKPRFTDRDANPMVQCHSEFAKLKFCIPRTRCEPYGAHPFWVGETKVLHSQNGMRTLWCTVILGWRNLSFAFPERDANPMVHIHSGLAKPRFCTPRTRCEPYGARSFWVAKA